MKKNYWSLSFHILTTLFVLLALFGCETVEDVFENSLKTAASEGATEAASDAASDASSGGSDEVDLKPGELLVLHAGNDPESSAWVVSKTLTPATAASKGEGEFIFVKDGDTRWTKWFADSYIPAPAQLEMGMRVFFCYEGMAHFSEIDANGYRNGWWYVGRITDLELYKDVVIVNGDAYQLAAIRLPTEPFDF